MNDYKVKSKKYSGGVKALLSDWMIVFLFVVLFALCCFNANFRTTTNIMNVLRDVYKRQGKRCISLFFSL